MMEAYGATSTLTPPEIKTSVLITVNTPGAETPICRIGNSEEVIKGLTVRELIQRVISPNSLFSVGVPLSQLQAEATAASAIGELMSADCCAVVWPGRSGEPETTVDLSAQVEAIAQEHLGMSGNRFFNVNLEVRSTQDTASPVGEERRQLSAPEMVEESVAQERPVFTANPMVTIRPAPPKAVEQPAEAPEVYVFSEDRQTAPAARAEVPAISEEDVQAFFAPEPPAAAAATPAPPPAPAAVPIMTIVAEKAPAEPKEYTDDRKEYARKSDWLRAQFQPEVEALDFSGLFVGNLGLGVLEEKAHRNVVLADPARITEVLLRANGYRRTGDHAKALIGYQELVDLDAANADFRFLLGTTLAALGQREQAAESFLRAKELGHDGAEKELNELKRTGHRPKSGFGFLRFWKG